MNQTTISHENGPWYTENGLMINKYNENACTNNPAVFLDTAEGCLLKSGDAQMVQAYAATVIDTYTKNGMTDFTKGMTVITFDRYAYLDIDAICSIMNWFNNSIGSKAMTEFLTMNGEQLKAKITELQQFGF